MASQLLAYHLRTSSLYTASNRGLLQLSTYQQRLLISLLTIIIMILIIIIIIIIIITSTLWHKLVIEWLTSSLLE